MANEAVGKLKRLQAQAQDAFDDAALARQEPDRLPWFQNLLHFWVLVGRSFVRNRAPLRASALAYASLLALVPMLALVLTVTTAILKTQGDKPIRDFVDKIVEYATPYINPGAAVSSGDAAVRFETIRQDAAAAREQAVRKINEFIDRAQSGAVGTTSAIVLLFVAISMLARIETTFNDIWGVTRGRSWYMRTVFYWAAITLGPVVLISALGLASAGELHFSENGPLQFINRIMQTTVLGELVGGVLPVLVLCLAFAMVYLLFPNTKVNFSAALVGGLTAGLLWHANNKLSVLFISRYTSNHAIYGGLAMVPVLMVGLYLGWLILLFGAQVAYAYQNRRAYLQEKQADAVHQRGREFAALRVMMFVALRFQRGERPPTLTRLAEATGVPTRLATGLLHLLVLRKIVAEINDRETAYVPVRPLNQITAHDILDAVRTGQGMDLATRDDPVRALVQGEFGRIAAAEQSVASNITLQTMVDQVAASTPSG